VVHPLSTHLLHRAATTAGAAASHRDRSGSAFDALCLLFSNKWGCEHHVHTCAECNFAYKQIPSLVPLALVNCLRLRGFRTKACDHLCMSCRGLGISQDGKRTLAQCAEGNG
jgi:hypothetical protein